MIISISSTVFTMLLILLLPVFIMRNRKRCARHVNYTANNLDITNTEFKDDDRYVQQEPLNIRREAVRTLSNTPKGGAESKPFEECNEADGKEKEATAENPSTPPEREDTLHRTEMSHTPSSMTPSSPGPAEPRNVFDEDDDVFGPPISPGTSQTQKRKPNRPRSESRRLSGADYQELTKETTSPPTVPAHPSRPKSGRHYSLSHMRSSVSLDPTEIESLLDTDTAPAPKSQ